MYLRGVSAPVHGVDLGEVTPQCFPGLHLDSAHDSDSGCGFLQSCVLHCLACRLQSKHKPR